MLIAAKLIQINKEREQVQGERQLPNSANLTQKRHKVVPRLNLQPQVYNLPKKVIYHAQEVNA